MKRKMNKHIIIFMVSASVLLATSITLAIMLMLHQFPDEIYAIPMSVTIIISMITLMFSFSKFPRRSPEELKERFEPCVCGHGKHIHLNSFAMLIGKEQLRNCEDSDCECREFNVRK